jgi:CubicO group peptidase (beta-lactamase class C family)
MSVRILAILTLAAAPPLPAQRPPLAGLDTLVARVMGEWGVPGLALAVVKDDSVVLARGYGVRSIVDRTPVDEHTIFSIGSATKSFTAAAIAMLADEGLLAWGDRVVDRLPGFALADPALTREIRLRDLVTHASGLPGGRTNLLWFGGALDRAEIVRRARFIEPTAGIREEFQYQNIMVLAAGQVVAEVSGRSWDAFVEERLFGPLGMRRTATSVTGLGSRGNVATPHARVAGELVTLPWRNIDNIGPAGSITSSARDMTGWLRLILGGGSYGGRRLLSPGATRELLTPRMVLPPARMGSMDVISRAGAPSRMFAYALGWTVFDYRGRTVAWHGGNIDGMSALVAMIPEERLGLVVLTNLNGSVLREVLMLGIFDRYLGAPPHDWSAALLAVVRADQPDPGRRARPAAAPADRPLAGFAGRFRDDLLGDLTVTPRDGHLDFALATGLTGRLIPTGGTRFRAEWDDPGIAVIVASLADAPVTFRFEGGGPAVEAAFEGVGVFRRR